MAMHKLPKNLPASWLASFKLPSHDGYYERWIVIHSSNSDYDKFVVHTATYYDEGSMKGEFDYASGTYCRTLARAQTVWLKQIGRYVEGVEVTVGGGGSDE